MRLLILCAVSLFCVTCLVACENKAPADQLTVVQGTVTSADTGRPLRGVLMGIASFKQYLFGGIYPTPTGDTIRTDARGKYELSFRNRKGLYYAVCFEPFQYTGNQLYRRYAFITNQGQGSAGGLQDNEREVTVGRTNTVDFAPNELRLLAVRIRNRNTGYQQLAFDYRTLRGNNLDSTAYLRGYYLSPPGEKFRYLKYNAAGAYVKDTLVSLVVLNPTALPPDTVRATLTFVR